MPDEKRKKPWEGQEVWKGFRLPKCIDCHRWRWGKTARFRSARLITGWEMLSENDETDDQFGSSCVSDALKESIGFGPLVICCRWCRQVRFNVRSCWTSINVRLLATKFMVMYRFKHIFFRKIALFEFSFLSLLLRLILHRLLLSSEVSLLLDSFNTGITKKW